MATRVVEFQVRAYKFSKVFAEKSTYLKEMIEFEKWCNGEVSKGAKI